jgi:hypothetical protein
LWSALSTRSQFVKDEASLAHELGKLVPVVVDQAELPLGFRRLHTVQMQGWQGSTTDSRFVELVEQLELKLGRLSAHKTTHKVRSSAPETYEPAGPGFQAAGGKSVSLPGKTITPKESGYDERELFELHADIDSAMFSRPYWRRRGLLAEHLDMPNILSFKAVWKPVKYGVLTKSYVEDSLPTVSAEKPVPSELTEMDMKELSLAGRGLELLRKLAEVGADAIDYTPRQLESLPSRLRDRAFYLLSLNRWGSGELERPRPLEVTQEMMDKFAESREKPTSSYDVEVLSEMRELAQHLGLRFKA